MTSDNENALKAFQYMDQTDQRFLLVYYKLDENYVLKQLANLCNDSITVVFLPK